MTETKSEYTLTFKSEKAAVRALNCAGNALIGMERKGYKPPDPSLVKAFIKVMGWTQADAAARLDVNASTVRRWCTEYSKQDHRVIPYSSWCLMMALGGFVSLDKLTDSYYK